jgi:hypothetical protein
MALYIPASRRRRTTVLAAIVALVIGVCAGVAVGRLSVPNVASRVSSVQDDARATSAALRVLSLHEESKLPNAGADLTLSHTRSELQGEFSKAPWIGAATRSQLLASLEALTAITDRTSTAFAKAADGLAHQIDTAFGIS